MEVREIIENFLSKRGYGDDMAIDLHYLQQEWPERAEELKEYFKNYDLSYTRQPNADHVPLRLYGEMEDLSDDAYTEVMNLFRDKYGLKSFTDFQVTCTIK